MKLKIKAATIARIGALLVVLANQCLALFGKGTLPFTENMAYQILSLVATIVIAAINAWENNDITKIARLAGKVFEALDDGKITDEEIEKMLKDVEADETAPTQAPQNFIVVFVNNIIASIKAKLKK